MKYTLLFEDINGMPLDLLENAGEKQLPVMLSEKDSIKSSVGIAHGFRVDKRRQVIDCEIIFGKNTNAMIAFDLFKNRGSALKLNPRLTKKYLGTGFIGMDITGFYIGETPKVVITKTVELKKTFTQNIYNKLKSWVNK